MRTFKFTDKAIKNLKNEDKQVDYYDNIPPRAGQAGQLGIRIGKRTKSWFVQYKFQKKTKRVTLKIKYPDLSLKEARYEAAKILGVVFLGEDPNEKIREKKAAPTMDDLWKVYCEHRDSQIVKKSLDTIKEEHRQWEKNVKPYIGHIKVADITPAMLADLMDRLAKSAPVSANRLYSIIRIVFKPALRKGWITVHPLQWVDKPGGKEVSRKRVLSDKEIKELWPYFDKELHNPRDYLKLGILTAQRPGEILAMRWGDVHIESATWENNVTKTDVINVVPLSSQVVEILVARQKVEIEKNGKLGEWVFPSTYNRTRKGAKCRGHAVSGKGARKRIREASGIEGWTSHDLRRTARTIMSRLQIEPHIRERVLAHSMGKVEGTYDRYDYLPEKRKALQKLGDEMDRIIGVETEITKVVKLRVNG